MERIQMDGMILPSGAIAACSRYLFILFIYSFVTSTPYIQSHGLKKCQCLQQDLVGQEHVC